MPFGEVRPHHLNQIERSVEKVRSVGDIVNRFRQAADQQKGTGQDSVYASIVDSLLPGGDNGAEAYEICVRLRDRQLERYNSAVNYPRDQDEFPKGGKIPKWHDLFANMRFYDQCAQIIAAERDLKYKPIVIPPEFQKRALAEEIIDILNVVKEHLTFNVTYPDR